MTEPGADPQLSPISGPPPQPDPLPRAQRNRFGVVGALLCLGAAVLTGIGSFQALYVVEIESVSGLWRQSTVVTSWDFELTTNGEPDPEDIGIPLNGVPLMFAVAVLLATAALGMLVAATSAGLSRFALAHRIAAVIAAVFLVATVWSVGMQELWYQDVLRPSDETSSINFTMQVGAGFWSLVAGAVLAVVAAVVAWRPARADVREREEPDTPVLGIPVVVHRLPDAPPDRPNGE